MGKDFSDIIDFILVVSYIWSKIVQNNGKALVFGESKEF